MKTCEEFAPLLSAYFDGELTERECAEVRAHLENCETCRVRLAEYAAVRSEMLTVFAEEEVPEGFAEGVMAAVRAEKAAAAPKKAKKRTWKRYLPIAACAAIVLLSASLFPQMSGLDGAKSADTAAPMMAQNASESASGGTADSEEDAVSDTELPESYYEYRDGSTYYAPVGDAQTVENGMAQTTTLKSADDFDLVYTCEAREIDGEEGLLWVHQQGPVVLELLGAGATVYVEENGGVKDGDAGYYYLPVPALLALPEDIGLSDVQAAELDCVPEEAEWVIVYPDDHSEVAQP